MTATRTIEDYVNLERCVDALEDERLRLQAQFQRETLRTSDLSVLLLEWINRHEAEHEPGVWSRSCGVCALVKRSRELLETPLNVTPNVELTGAARHERKTKP